MVYRFLADTAVVLHLAFIVFAMLGGLLALRRPRWAWSHLPVLLWAAVVECKGWICPLTYLENRLRTEAGLAGYPGGFIEHYLIPVVYPEALTRSTQMLLGAALICFNVVIYAFVMINARRRGSQIAP